MRGIYNISNIFNFSSPVWSAVEQTTLIFLSEIEQDFNFIKISCFYNVLLCDIPLKSDHGKIKYYSFLSPLLFQLVGCSK